MLLLGELTDSIIGSFYTAYDKLGYGFLEKIYCRALVIELGRRGHTVECQVPVAVYYDDINIGSFKMDLVVDHLIVVEVKSSAALCEADHAQLVNYLRSTRFDVGLLLHFGPKPKVYRKISTEEFKR